MAAGSMAKATIHEPVGAKDLWHHKGWQLPAYIQHVANDLRESGHDESRAIQIAVGVIKNWAAGHDGKGHRVSATTQAAAAKALAEWEALKARAAASHSLTAAPVRTVDLAEPHPGQRYRHGWIPIAGVPGLTVEEHKKPGASLAVAHTVRLHDEVIGHIRPSGDRFTAHRRTGDAKDMRKMSGGFKSLTAAATWVHGSKAHPGVPTSPNASGGTIDRVEAAARMFGRGSKQHKAAAKKFGVNLTAAPSSTVDLAADPVFATTDGPTVTVPAGSRHYRHGWVRIDAAGPSAVERATRVVATDGHALLHGAGMVPAAQKVVERAKAAGHRVTVSRVDVRGTPHLHVARRGTDLTAGPTQTVDLAFTEALHPRGAKGASNGGKFVAKNSASSPAKSKSGGSSGGGLPANVAANVRDFQRRNHLPVTGVIDQATAAKIRADQAPKGRGKSKGAAKTKARKAAAAARRAAKAAARAKKQQTAQHVATVNAMTPAQRASARAAVPVPPTGYVWTPTNTLRRYP